MRSMVFISTSKFLLGSRLVFGSLLFIADKMRDLSLWVPESMEIVGSDDDRFPSVLVRVGLACEAQLGHRSSDLGESKLDPSGDCIDHHGTISLKGVDPIYKSSSGSNSDND
jgi:hypothetical protein